MLVSAPISSLHKRQSLALIIFRLSDPIPRIARRADPFLCKGSWYGRLAGTGHADSPGRRRVRICAPFCGSGLVSRGPGLPPDAA